MSCRKHVSIISCLRLLVTFCLSSSFSATLSAPTSPTRPDTALRSSILVPRYDVVSTEQYWADILRTGKVYSFPGVFWTSYATGWEGFFAARNWGKQYFGRKGFVMYDTASDTYQAIMTIDPCDPATTAQDILRVQHMSKAFAASVYGTAYLAMPDNAPVYPGSVWSESEWPVITRNRLVLRVIRVDLPSGRQSLFWAREDGPRGTTPPPGKRKIKKARSRPLKSDHNLEDLTSESLRPIG